MNPAPRAPLPPVPVLDPRRRGTIAAASATLTGIGLNTGRTAGVTLHPAPPGTGIRFRWRARPEAPALETTADWRLATLRPFCTALRLPGTERVLRLPEHLLAAAAALGVDDLLAEVTGEPELPILDGSAEPWCRLMLTAGLRQHDAPREPVRLRETVEVSDTGRFIRAEPAERLSFDISLDLASWGELHWSGVPLGQVFVAELAPARSFGRLHRAIGAALLALAARHTETLRGARLGNTAALVGGRILGGARVPQEPVRHRALDVLGDLALLGAPLVAHVTIRRPGHALNQAFVRKLAEHHGAPTAAAA